MPATLPSLTKVQPPAIKRLLSTQDPTGGWAEHPGARLSPMNTAEVVLALTSANVAAGDPLIKKAVVFLYAQRKPLPAPDDGCWSRSTGGAGATRDTPDIIRTCLVARALVSAGEEAGSSNVRSAFNWLVKRQNADAGWGFRRGEPSAILPTCFTLLALIRTAQNSKLNLWADEINRALQRLMGFRNNSGSFGTGLLQAAHTIHAVLVLQAARECEFAILATAESEAIRWLLDQPDDAMSTVEEEIAIDAEREANWGFTFTMDALLLAALGRSSMPDHRKTDFWTRVQRSVYGNFDETSGGLYGKRVFSWSTAAALYAISLTEAQLAEIPATPPEDPSGTKVGNWILALALALMLTMVYLRQNFNLLQALFLGFLMLACLLAYGKIGEKTFRQLVQQGLKSGRKDA